MVFFHYFCTLVQTKDLNFKVYHTKEKNLPAFKLIPQGVNLDLIVFFLYMWEEVCMMVLQIQCEFIQSMAFTNVSHREDRRQMLKSFYCFISQIRSYFSLFELRGRTSHCSDLNIFSVLFTHEL